MYEIIEKEFKKDNPYKKYRIAYWINFFALVIITNLLNIIFKINNCFLAFITSLLFLISVFTFIYWKIKKSYNKCEFKKYGFKKYGFKKSLKKYIQNLNATITRNLINTLKENNINSKDKIKILIDYYNRKEPINTKSNFTSVIADFFITIASIVVIAYNDVTGIIETNKFINIISFTFLIAAITIILTLAIKLIFRSIFFPKEYFNSSLLEELTYIYMNYEEYEAKLNK